jgi:uncharacterized protein involved in cysteine biosynthesis
MNLLLAIGMLIAMIVWGLLVAYVVNFIFSCVADILSIPWIKRIARAKWCKELRIYYRRRRYPRAEY